MNNLYFFSYIFHWEQPSLKYILKNRNNELSSKQICGIVQSQCSDNPYVMDFTIQIDQGPPQKVSRIELDLFISSLFSHRL